MATTTYTVLPVGNRKGTIQSGAVNWPSTLKTARFRVNSTAFTDPATQIDMFIEQSFDNGTTWGPWASNEGLTGGQLDRQGNPALPSIEVAPDPATASIPRQVRGRIVVTGTIRFGVLADLSD